MPRRQRRHHGCTWVRSFSFHEKNRLVLRSSELVQGKGSNKGCFCVKDLTGKTLTMTSPLDSSVSTLAHDVSGITRIPVDLFYFMVAGKVLESSSTLSQAGVGKNVTIQMSIRLKGGVRHDVPSCWTCMVCNMGGCWQVRQSCFRWM